MKKIRRWKKRENARVKFVVRAFMRMWENSADPTIKIPRKPEAAYQYRNAKRYNKLTPYNDKEANEVYAWVKVYK